MERPLFWDLGAFSGPGTGELLLPLKSDIHPHNWGSGTEAAQLWLRPASLPEVGVRCEGIFALPTLTVTSTKGWKLSQGHGQGTHLADSLMEGEAKKRNTGPQSHQVTRKTAKTWTLLILGLSPP